jgi:quercetin dioxygenase-like cupin family protein
MSKDNAGWEHALTVLQEVRPPFIPESAEVKIVVADLPPGSAGFPPHRHSGPSFYYMLEGELQFELEGEPSRVIRAGEAFWEPGGDVTHYTNANNRDDIRCRFVVTLVSRSNSATRELVPSRTSLEIAPSESDPGKNSATSKNYDGWENALTVLQEAWPPFIPEGVYAVTVVVEHPPGSAGSPPHRHSGPAFGYVLEGEMLFELEGEPPRVIRAGEAFWEPGGDAIHYSNANNRDDMRCRYTVTMLAAPGQPMLTPVDAEDLEVRKHLRVPAESNTPRSPVKE